MKNLIIFSVLVLFYACGSGPCACKSGAENVTTVTAMYDAFAEGNVDAVVAGMASDIQWNESENFIYAEGNPYVGPDAVVEGVFARLGADWDSWTLTNKSYHPVGADQVLVTGRYEATHKASGNAIDAQFAHVWKLADGKAVSFQQYTDTKQVAEAFVVADDEDESEGEDSDDQGS